MEPTFKQLQTIDTALLDRRRALKKRCEQLAKRPVGRNYLARERHLHLLQEQVDDVDDALEVVREALRPHFDELRRGRPLLHG